MRRTQLYLDDDLWEQLHERAKAKNTTVSELVREAVRSQLKQDVEERRKAMEAIVGMRADWPADLDTDEYIRDLRTDDRLERLERLWKE